MATDKRLQSIEEFPHISWIIGTSGVQLWLKTNAGYHHGVGLPLAAPHNPLTRFNLSILFRHSFSLS